MAPLRNTSRKSAGSAVRNEDGSAARACPAYGATWDLENSLKSTLSGSKIAKFSPAARSSSFQPPLAKIFACGRRAAPMAAAAAALRRRIVLELRLGLRNEDGAQFWRKKYVTAAILWFLNARY